MKCTRAHELIGELLEETISEEDRRELDTHLESCPECRSLLADFREIKTQAAELPKLEPSASVWTGVLDRVRAQQPASGARSLAAPSWLDRLFPPGRPRYAFAATLALLAVVGGFFLFRAPASLPPWGSDAYTLAKLEEAETHYRLAIQALSEAAAAQKSRLDGGTQASLDQDLRTIDAVIASCLDAVRKDPGSLEARVYLLGAYKGKVEVLDAVLASNQTSAAPAAGDTIL